MSLPRINPRVDTRKVRTPTTDSSGFISSDPRLDPKQVGSRPTGIDNYLPETRTGSTQGNYLDRYPEKVNYLQQPGFKFSLLRSPHLSYFCQTATIPGIQVEALDRPTNIGMLPIPVAGHASKDDFEITFIVNEDLSNWLEIYNWMRSLTTFDDYDEYKESNTHYSNAILMTLNSAMNLNFEVEIKDLFPKSLSSIEMTTTAGTINPIEATATFAYTSYEIRNIGNQTG